MKNILFKLLVLSSLSASVFFLSCKKFGDTNVDPTKATSIDPALQVGYIQMRLNGDYYNERAVAQRVLMPLVQQISGGGYGSTTSPGSTYTWSAYWGDINWEMMFHGDGQDNGWTNTGVIPNIVDAVRQSDAVKTTRPNINAITRIMRVYVFSRMTDLYGDMPYFDAGNGLVTGNMQPKFDKQADIYADFFKELSACTAQLDVAKDVVANDQYYNGNISLWKKFANSLHLRLAMNLVKIDPATAQKEAEAAVTDGVFTSNADMCVLNHTGSIEGGDGDSRCNGIAANFADLCDFFAISTPFANLLKQVNQTDPQDPRLNVWFRCYYSNLGALWGAYTSRPDITNLVRTAAKNRGIDTITTVPAGSYSLNKWVTDSLMLNVPGNGIVLVTRDQALRPANFFIDYNAPSIVLSYSEVELLMAEMAVRGWNAGSGTATQHYQNGIRACIDQQSFYPKVDANGPFVDPAAETKFVNFSVLIAGNELQQINNQLYITFFMNPIQAFTNWRRSGYPTLSISPTATTASIPRRWTYSMNEKNTNADNANAAIVNITGPLPGQDSHLNRVWWDK